MTTLDATVPAAAFPPAPPPRTAQFIGLDGPYWRLMIHGAVLLLFTLGIYRFWLATDQRRFLWSHTEVGGNTAEYTGTARELLIGFLIALAILVPIYALLFVLAIHFELVGALASIIAFVGFAFLGNYAIYRARRYRLTRTIYRGVRFYQTGSAWRYAIYAMLWWALIILTFGLAYPWAQAQLEGYKMRHTYFGNLEGRFEGTGLQLFLRGIFMWLVVMAPLIVGLVSVILTFDSKTIEDILKSDGSEEAFLRAVESHPGFWKAAGFLSGATAWSVVLAILLYPVFQSMTYRWWASGLRIGEVTMSSKLLARRVYGTYLAYIGYMLLFSGALGVILTIVGAGAYVAFKDLQNTEYHELIGSIAIILVYVVFALGASTIYQVKVKLNIWRLVVDSLDLANLEALDKVSAAGAPSTALGEGLADALDVGGL